MTKFVFPACHDFMPGTGARRIWKIFTANGMIYSQQAHLTGTSRKTGQAIIASLLLDSLLAAGWRSK